MSVRQGLQAIPKLGMSQQQQSSTEHTLSCSIFRPIERCSLARSPSLSSPSTASYAWKALATAPRAVSTDSLK